jgi:hypothetical protein
MKKKRKKALPLRQAKRRLERKKRNVDTTSHDVCCGLSSFNFLAPT